VLKANVPVWSENNLPQPLQRKRWCPCYDSIIFTWEDPSLWHDALSNKKILLLDGFGWPRHRRYR
jgi:hypothetical protein